MAEYCVQERLNLQLFIESVFRNQASIRFTCLATQQTILETRELIRRANCLIELSERITAPDRLD